MAARVVPAPEKPWTTYRFFDVRTDAFDTQKHGPLAFKCAASGHGMLGLGDDTFDGTPMIALYENNQQEPSKQIIIDEICKIRSLFLSWNWTTILAVCEFPDKYTFFFRDSKTGAKTGAFSIPKKELPDLRLIAGSPKLKRIMVQVTDTRIAVYEFPFSDRTKAVILEMPEPITNILACCDTEFQRIIYVTTDQRCIYYRRSRPGQFGEPLQLRNDGPAPGLRR
jgi:hypothetical protein